MVSDRGRGQGVGGTTGPLDTALHRCESQSEIFQLPCEFKVCFMNSSVCCVLCAGVGACGQEKV